MYIYKYLKILPKNFIFIDVNTTTNNNNDNKILTNNILISSIVLFIQIFN